MGAEEGDSPSRLYKEEGAIRGEEWEVRNDILAATLNP